MTPAMSSSPTSAAASLRLTPLIDAIRFPSSMPALSAGLPVRTEVTSTPSVSRLDAALDVVMPMTAWGWPVRDSRYGPASTPRPRGILRGERARGEQGGAQSNQSHKTS